MDQLNDIIAWLIGLERLAAEFYREASGRFSRDAAFARFLEEMARDEEWHIKVMERAAELASTEELPRSQILLDDPLRSRVERTLIVCRTMLTRESSSERLLASIIDAEYSEWNDIFYYVLNVLKERSRSFEDAAAKMQQHKNRMEQFLERYPSGSALLGKIRNLPTLWKERLLLIEDYMPIRRVLADILSQFSAVTTAENGREGLDRLKESYFDVVISDIDMPVMDGYDFYREATRAGHDLAERILFIAANPFEARITTLAQQGLPFFAKPVPVLQLEEKVLAMLGRTRTGQAFTKNGR